MGTAHGASVMHLGDTHAASVSASNVPPRKKYMLGSRVQDLGQMASMYSEDDSDAEADTEKER